MPMYDYRCPSGHTFERLVPISEGRSQPCPACDADSSKVPSGVAILGRASTGLSKDQMPQTWRGTYNADREYVGQLRRSWEKRQQLEARHPELAGDQRPILAHEGRYHGAPLRAGDPELTGSASAAPAADPAGAPTAGHGHGHSHGPGHEHRSNPGPGTSDGSASP
jgi:putative FmdB family regulatory protein